MARFPALDPEPPPLTLRQRLLRAVIAVGILVVLVAAGIGGRAVFHSAAHAPAGHSAATGPPGSLLVQTTIGLSITDARGGNAKALTGFGALGYNIGYVSPDGRYLLDGAGGVTTLANGRPVSTSTALYAPLSASGPNSGIFSQQPFADHGSRVLFSTNLSDSGSTVVESIPTTGGKPQSLGNAANYAGDPQQDAAYVVPASGPSRVEHRVVGGPTTTLITAARLGTVFNLPAGNIKIADLAADPAGDRIAAAVNGLGVVVLSRSGAVVAHTVGAPGGPLYWSPPGAALLFSASGAATLWPIDGSPQTVLTANESLLNFCIWSPDGQYVACAGYGGVDGRRDAWVLVDAASATAQVLPDHGVPLLWSS